MGTLNLHFEIEYFKTKMSMNFKIGTYIQQDLGVTLPIFGKIGQRYR